MIIEQELEREKARTEGARVSYEFMKRHLTDFDQSPESAKKIQDYLVEHNLDFSEQSLETAFTDLTAKGVRFMTASVAAPAEEEPLPPVPPYMEHIKTKKDALKCPQYTEWLRGKHGHLWKERVNEIMRRGK